MGKNVFGDFASDGERGRGKVCTYAIGNSFLVKKLCEDFTKIKFKRTSIQKTADSLQSTLKNSLI